MSFLVCVCVTLAIFCFAFLAYNIIRFINENCSCLYSTIIYAVLVAITLSFVVYAGVRRDEKIKLECKQFYNLSDSEIKELNIDDLIELRKYMDEIKIMKYKERVL